MNPFTAVGSVHRPKVTISLLVLTVALFSLFVLESTAGASPNHSGWAEENGCLWIGEHDYDSQNAEASTFTTDGCDVHVRLAFNGTEVLEDYDDSSAWAAVGSWSVDFDYSDHNAYVPGPYWVGFRLY